MNESPRFIFVIGGVISGLGKGIFTASLGKVLQMAGYNINLIKIDPYLNIDAGTMRPTEHGEVWVTYDGGEIDQDLGNYERFLHKKISKRNNITSGKILLQLIKDERNGKYLGKTVQYIPHATNKVQEMLTHLHKKNNADISIVEIGGTVGDFESNLFLHAASRIQDKYPTTYVFMGYLLYPPHIGELKTKPFQHALKSLFTFGISPNVIVLRSPRNVDYERKEKIAIAGNVSIDSLIELTDTNNIYEIPEKLSKHRQAIKNLLVPLRLKFPKTPKYNKASKTYSWFVAKTNKIEKQNRGIDIAIVGKYLKTGNFVLKDSYISVLEALKFAAWSLRKKVHIHWIDSVGIEGDQKIVKKELSSVKAIIVPGGFGTSGIKGKLKAIQFARENKIPYLGLCYGLQLAVIEYAQNIANLKDANSTEINPKTPYPVIDILPTQKEILKNSKYGASMRLGEYKAYLKQNTIVFNVYQRNKRLFKDKNGFYVIERHRHRYEVNPQYHDILQESGLVFSGTSKDKTLIEFIELPKEKHPYFVGTQAHPEFTSYPEDPNPLFWGLIKATEI